MPSEELQKKYSIAYDFEKHLERERIPAANIILVYCIYEGFALEKRLYTLSCLDC